MYYGIHAIGFLAAGIYMYLFAPKYNFKRWRAVLLTVLTYASIYALMLVIYYLITGKFGGQNIVRVFVFVPPVAVLYGAALGMDARRVLDIFAPVPCIAQGISHFACLIPGCCRSWLRVDWGVYNQKVGERLFPVQICEAVTALVIVAILILVCKKHGYDFRGRAMPLMLLLFGATRFGWEFLRENDAFMFGVSELALWAAGTALVGAIWLFIDRPKRTQGGKGNV